MFGSSGRDGDGDSVARSDVFLPNKSSKLSMVLSPARASHSRGVKPPRKSSRQNSLQADGLTKVRRQLEKWLNVRRPPPSRAIQTAQAGLLIPDRQRLFLTHDEKGIMTVDGCCHCTCRHRDVGGGGVRLEDPADGKLKRPDSIVLRSTSAICTNNRYLRAHRVGILSPPPFKSSRSFDQQLVLTTNESAANSSLLSWAGRRRRRRRGASQAIMASATANPASAAECAQMSASSSGPVGDSYHETTTTEPTDRRLQTSQTGTTTNADDDDDTLLTYPLSNKSLNGSTNAITAARNQQRHRFNIIVINVGGMRYETQLETLQYYPDSLLGHPMKRQRYYNPETGEYFFDRHRSSFESILYIYLSRGRVERPDTIPWNIYMKELKFFEMGEEIMDKFWASEGWPKLVEVDMPKNKLQRQIWDLMEYPDSSLCARIFAFISVFVIILSIICFCLETLPSSTPIESINNTTIGKNGTIPLSSSGDPIHWGDVFYVIEFSCVMWFTVEFLLRFASSPSKVEFCKSFLNIIDMVAIVPFYVKLLWPAEPTVDEPASGKAGMSFTVLRVLRLVRVFRIFKLSRHSVGLQILGRTFRASVQEFCLLIFFMAIAVVLFSSGMYFAEFAEPNTKFTSIPACFWFTLVTMTTVGYGDMAPTGVYGKIVGSCCALIGVLTLALPVPIIVANFKLFYRLETKLAEMRQELDEEEEDDENIHRNSTSS